MRGRPPAWRGPNPRKYLQKILFVVCVYRTAALFIGVFVVTSSVPVHFYMKLFSFISVGINKAKTDKIKTILLVKPERSETNERKYYCDVL